MPSVQPLMFIQLNEINFDIVREYLARFDDLPNFKSILTDFQAVPTHAEKNYAELEPWIQWVSIQTGKPYAEHRVFRLGDIVDAPDHLVQIFEVLESRGLRVGAISPMNARNRLTNPAYFVPDPWTNTPSDGTPFLSRVTAMLRQSVNDNAVGRLTLRSKLTILEVLMRTFDWPCTRHIFRMLREARTRPWTRALILDQLIHLLHRTLWLRSRPDVSFVFFNAGAHLQHHYLFSAEPRNPERCNPDWYISPAHDPIRDMLRFYDRILGDCLALTQSRARLIVATGLTQVPYDRVKFYYRLRDHVQFLRHAGIPFAHVLPRMTRDFEIVFDTPDEVAVAHRKLSAMRIERTGGAMFGDFEPRQGSLFASLIYPNEINDADVAVGEGAWRLPALDRHVAFVAIKNGMHSTDGFAYFSPDCRLPQSLPPGVPVSRLFDLTCDQFAG
jgi:hypothetical protein